MRNPSYITSQTSLFQDGGRKADNLFKVFGDIHNHIYANDGLSAQEAFSEVLKILFIKIEDEKKHKKSPGFYITQDEFKFIDKTQGREFEERILKLFDAAKREYTAVFQPDEKIQLKITTLAYIVKKLQTLDLSGSDRDVKGIAFQKFVYSQQRGERGQFFTPEPIVRLCVEFLAPKRSEKVLDLACGSGGFLIEAMRYVFEHDFSKVRDVQQRKARETEYAQRHLFGIEINSLVARVAKMRMILEDDGHSGIVNASSLSTIDDLRSEFEHSTNLKEIVGAFDIILTNPPFGSQGKITDERILRDFSLGYKWALDKGKLAQTGQLQGGQVPEILFIERCLELLKDGGKLAIVLPNGDFENSSLDYVREFIRSKARITAVVALPSETFIPYGTGVKASVLFCQKYSQDELAERKAYQIFFAKITKVGYEGNKNGLVLYKKDSNGRLLKDDRGSFVVDEDITKIISAHATFKEGGKVPNFDNLFTLSSSELDNRLDVEYYNPEYRKVRRVLKRHGAARLGDLVDIVTRRSQKLKKPELVIKYVELSDASPLNGELVSFTELPVHEAPSRASYEIEEGDIVTAVAGNSVGTKNHATAIVSKDFDGAVCTNGFRVLKVKGINAYYLFAMLRSEIFLSQVFRLRTGAAIPSISDQDLKDVLIPIVSEEEQNEIAKIVTEGLALRERSKQLFENMYQSKNFFGKSIVR